MPQSPIHATTTTSAPPRVVTYTPRRLKAIARRWRLIDEKWIKRIAVAEHQGQVERAKGLRRQHLGSASGVFVALEQDNARRKVRYRKNLRELVTIAETLNPWRATNDRVRVTATPKRHSEYRHICAFGTSDRALQAHLRRSIEAGATFDPAQFGISGRGGQRAAIEAVHAAIATGAYKFAIRFDVKNCYPSLTLEGIARTLGIPPKVIQNVAMVNTDAMDISYPGDMPRVCAPIGSPRGIAQGSLASPTIANIVLKPLLGHVPASAFKVMWVDDLIVLTRTKVEAIAIQNALCAAATQLPVGSLRLTCGPVRRLSDGKTFLGSTLRRKKGVTTLEPSAATKNKFTDKAIEILSRPASAARERDYKSLAHGFMAQHRLWSGVERWTKLRRHVVKAHMRPDFARLRGAVNYFRVHL